MSILTGKHVLVVGEETEQISKIEAALITYGADITTTDCASVTSKQNQLQNAGLIIINHLHDGAHSKELLVVLKEAEETRPIPVVALVQSQQSAIGEVLLRGAADYFTPSEDVHIVIDKIKAVFSTELDHQEHSAITITATDASVAAGARVFVVEDDPLLQNLLAVRFEKSGVIFEIASDGNGLIKKIETFKPEIIILDLMLPGEDGFELLAAIKKQSAIADIPVLIFSNKDSQEDRAQAAALGAKGFYVKAMTDLSELLDIIDQHKLA